MRTVGWVVTLLAVAAAGFYVHTLVRPPAGGAGDSVRHSGSVGPTVEQVQKLSKLVSLRVPISDVQVSELRGFTGGLRLVLAVHGDVEIATDLSAASFEQIDPEKKTALLVLPRPRPMRPRLDHEKTRILELDRNGLWRWVNGEAGEQVLTNRAMAYAQQVLGEVAAKAEIADQGCRHTETVMREFFGAMGWTVTLQWKEPKVEEAVGGETGGAATATSP